MRRYSWMISTLIVTGSLITAGPSDTAGLEEDSDETVTVSKKDLIAAFYFYIERNNNSNVERLLTQHPNLDLAKAKSPNGRTTPLHEVGSSNAPLFELLLKHGAPTNALNNKKESVPWSVYFRSNLIQAIVEAENKLIDEKEEEEKSPLRLNAITWSIEKFREKVIQDHNNKRSKKASEFSVNILYESQTLLQFFLQRIASDGNGSQEFNYIESVKHLLNHKGLIFPTLSDKEQKTFYDIFMKSEDDSITEDEQK